MEGNITITKDEYFGLKKAALTLEILESSGVDNWEGYGEGFEDFDEQVEKLKKEIDETR